MLRHAHVGRFDTSASGSSLAMASLLFLTRCRDEAACFNEPVLLTLALMMDSKDGSKSTAGPSNDTSGGFVAMLSDRISTKAFW